MKGNSLIIIFVAVIFVIFMCIFCYRKDGGTQSSRDTTPEYSRQTYIPQKTNYTPDTVDRKLSDKVLQTSKTNVSKWYQKGYDAGYDDGEDDAINRNGFQGQFDDSNHYKGKKKKEYEEGYNDGYEAGFDDNMADDGSDEEYE